MPDKTIRELRNEIEYLGKHRDMVIDRALRKVSDTNKKILKLEDELAKARLNGAKPPTQ